MGIFKKKITKCSFDAALDWDLEAGDVPSFKMTPAYNGGKLSVRGFDAPVIVELKTARFEKENVKINADHDQKKTVGHAENQSISGEGIFLDGLLSKVNEHVDRIVSESKNNFPHEASIEASFPPAQLVKAGQEAKVNGKVFVGPFYIARNAVITGVAILDRGADRHTNVSIAAELQIEEYSMTLQELFAKHEIDPTAEDAAELLEAALAPKVEPVTAEPVLAQVAEVQAITAEEAQKQTDELIGQQRKSLIAEANRQAEVKAVCIKYDHPEVKQVVAGIEQLVDLHSFAIEAGWDKQTTEFEAMKWQLDQKSAGGRPGIHDATQEDMNADVIECSLALTAGLTEEAAGRNGLYSQEVIDISTQSRFRGMKPSELVNRTLRAAGMPTFSRLNNEYIQQMKAAHRKLEASGFTTLSVPGILSNVANKTLLAAYRRSESFIPFVFGRASRTDFKPAFAYQLEGEGRLLPLGKDGEIKHGKVVENEFTSKLETYARMLAWTREDMINDDLGSLGRTSDFLGVMAFKARELAAAQFVILPTATFWVNNVNSFTSRDFGIDGMTASEDSFNGITDSEGLPISVGGGNVLLPHVLKIQGMQLKNQTDIRDPSATEKVFINNPHAGLFECLATPWINNAQVNSDAANRDKTWYRFADPLSAPALEVSYLNGVDTPTIESDETDFNTLGMQFRCYFDFGFGANDSKYAQRNIGA